MPGATPTYSFPYPVLSDTPNGATEVQSLASAVDTQLAVTDSNVATLTANKNGQHVGGWVRNNTTGTTGLGASVETDLGAQYTTNNITFTLGRAYRLRLSFGCQAVGGAANDPYYFYLRTVAAVGGGGSVIIPQSGAYASKHFNLLSNDDWFDAEWLWVPAATVTTPVFTSYKRLSGTSTLSIYGTGASLSVVDAGLSTLYNVH